jgi:DNA-binding CsgD family transcriptional regulator/tetratricopeptide (TPR) repeat protein
VVLAPREAAAQWLRLIELWPQLPDSESIAGLSEIDANLHGMQSLSHAGRLTDAYELAVDARRRLSGQANPPDQVRLHAAVGAHSHRESEVGFAANAQAIKIGASLPPSREYVSALRSYGNLLGDRGRYGERSQLWWRAATIAQEHRYLPEEKAAMADLLWDPVFGGSVADTQRHLDRTLQISLDACDPIADLYPLVTISDLMLKLNRLADIVELALPVVLMAEDRGLSNALLMNILRGNVHEALIELGQVGRSAAMLDAVPTPRPERGNLPICMAKAESDLLRGRTEDAATLWVDSRDVVEGDLHFDVWYNLALRRLEFDIWRGAPATSVSYAIGVLEHNVTQGQDVLSGDLFAMTMRACAEMAYTARARSDRAQLSRALDYAQHLSDLVATAPGYPFAEHSLLVNHHAYGLSWHAELSRVHGGLDTSGWARAVAAWDDLGRPFRAAYARWRQAEAILASRGPRAEATDLLRVALEQSIEHVPLHQAITHLTQLARIDVGDDRAETAHDPLTDTAPFGLTDRELQVLRLVAQGKTNAEVGKVLYISTKTASVHVTNILRKLGVGSRVMAATLAQRAGLVDK